MRRVLVVVLLMGACLGAQETRYHQLSARAKGSDGAIKIIASTWLGGPGAEELVAACYQPSGALLAVGNAWGPRLPGARVWGPDNYRDAPVWSDPGRHLLDHANPNRAGCVWRLSPDLAKVEAMVRLGWGMGVFTSAAVGADGALYLGGLGRDPFVNWARPQPGAKLGPPSPMAAGGSALFVMRCRADLTAVDWIAVFERGERQAADVERPVGGRVGARFRILGERELVAQAYGRLYSLNAGSGAARELGPTKGGMLLAADPRQGRIYTGGDEPAFTGREPWQRPLLTAYDRVGRAQWQYWRWDGRQVGPDAYRLVADSSVRGLTPLAEGKVLAWGQSDGGNSVFGRQPTNLDQPAPVRQGFVDSLAGAGAGSYGWLLAVDTAKAEVYAATHVASFQPSQDKPNSSRIDGACLLGGRRVAVVGSAAFAFVESPDAWVRTGPEGGGGPYFAIYSETLGDLLFGSLLPGVDGPLAMARRETRVAIVGTGVAPVDPAATRPPLIAPRQAELAGAADGYVLVAEVGR
ncbi:MAG: hypothetical protein HZB16_05605 [Armatimonadetes bacterium]|nr:hypothetical protein [Armatimonadota bacterium]